MQVVTDHDDGCPRLGPHLFQQLIERRLPRLVETLRRLVKDQDLRFGQKRAGQQHPLQLPTRERDDLPPAKIGHAGTGQNGGGGGIADRARQRQEAAHRHRQRRVEVQALRHITDPQARPMPDRARTGPLKPDQRPDQRRFAGTVGAEDRHDFPRCDGEIDAGQDRVVAAPDGKPLRLNQRHDRHPCMKGKGPPPQHCCVRPQSRSRRRRGPPPRPPLSPAPQRPRCRRGR